MYICSVYKKLIQNKNRRANSVRYIRLFLLMDERPTGGFMMSLTNRNKMKENTENKDTELVLKFVTLEREPHNGLIVLQSVCQSHPPEICLLD